MTETQPPTPRERMSEAAEKYGWTEQNSPYRWTTLFEQDAMQIVVSWSILDRVRKAELRIGTASVTKIEGGTPGVLASLRIFGKRGSNEDR